MEKASKTPELLAVGAGGIILLGVFLSKSASAPSMKTTVVQPSPAALNAASANYATSLNNQLQSRQLDYTHQENVLNIGVKREDNAAQNVNKGKAIDAQANLQAAQQNQQYQINQQQLSNQSSDSWLSFLGPVVGTILGVFGL